MLAACTRAGVDAVLQRTERPACFERRVVEIGREFMKAQHSGTEFRWVVVFILDRVLELWDDVALDAGVTDDVTKNVHNLGFRDVVVADTALELEFFFGLHGAVVLQSAVDELEDWHLGRGTLVGGVDP